MLPSEDQAGFIDAVDWESIKKQGDEAIKRWIKRQLEGTSVTAVLIGAETADRDWVLYEIMESWNRGNGVVGIRIHNVKDSERKTDAEGANPLDKFKLPNGKPLSSVCKVYGWVGDNGRDNLGTWLDEAAEIRAQFDDDAVLKKTNDVLATAAATIGALALGALAAKAFSPRPQSPPSPPAPTRSPSFTPRAPWSWTNDHD